MVPPRWFQGVEIADVSRAIASCRKQPMTHENVAVLGYFGAVLLGSVSGRTIALQLIRTYIFARKRT